MADRRSLLDTGKDIGSSVAGTVAEKGRETGQRAQSVAGTLSEQARERGGQARSLAGTLADTGEKVASGARTGVERAEEIRENFIELTDENVTPGERTRINRAAQDAREESQQPGQGTFQSEFQDNLVDEAYDMELAEQSEQEGPRGVGLLFGPNQVENAGPAQPQNTMAFGGFAPPEQGRQQKPPEKTEQLFGVGSQSRDNKEQIAPLFGFRY